jgi:hypothetical protein
VTPKCSASLPPLTNFGGTRLLPLRFTRDRVICVPVMILRLTNEAPTQGETYSLLSAAATQVPKKSLKRELCRRADPAIKSDRSASGAQRLADAYRTRTILAHVIVTLAYKPAAAG